MADVTGPISTLPGTTRNVPVGTKCDNNWVSSVGRGSCHNMATTRIQGETDSFGSEMHDLCDECAKAEREAIREGMKGKCDWCNKDDCDHLINARDVDEGMHGPVYRVCESCYTIHLESLDEELVGYY